MRTVATFIAFVKSTLGEAVSDVRASDRLTESAVCLVAPECGLDRQLEKLLAGAGRLGIAARSRCWRSTRRTRSITALAGARRRASSRFREDAAQPAARRGARRSTASAPRDAKAFSERLGRVIGRALPG